MDGLAVRTQVIMDSIGRKSLEHGVPHDASLDPELEVFFVTICCIPRGMNQLAHADVWKVIDDTLRHREAQGDIRCRMVLAMPDHLHGLFSFPFGGMAKQISLVKEWVAKKAGVRWQRDFFDHRIRSWESGLEKAEYVRENPVRGGLGSVFERLALSTVGRDRWARRFFPNGAECQWPAEAPRPRGEFGSAEAIRPYLCQAAFGGRADYQNGRA
jgi:putative transposase